MLGAIVVPHRLLRIENLNDPEWYKNRTGNSFETGEYKSCVEMWTKNNKN